VYDTVVSVDAKGVIEYWSTKDYSFAKNVSFKFKTETDLYEFAKVPYLINIVVPILPIKQNTIPVSLEFSLDGKKFVAMGKDRRIRIFKFLTGKLYRTYDESLNVFNKLQKVHFSFSSKNR
jgi:peptidylprolyl isomerase domain and WD repeat-containing protein 1